MGFFMFTRRDLKYFELAKSMAEEAEHYKARIGAVIVRKNKVLSKACNAEKSHPKQKEFNKFRTFDNHACGHNIHAEMKAILEAKKIHRDIRGSKIYIFRYAKDKTCGISKPCLACQAALLDCGIHDVFYTMENSFIYEKFL
jgi:deoxycytidylate deaminase